jgi:hypothetical protein
MSIVRICIVVLVRMMGSVAIAVFAISCAAPAMQIDEPAAPAALPSEQPLARFMREEVGVPFSFVMLETASTPRERRVHKAAGVLREAATSLVHWTDPPVPGDEARGVFYAYAENLELHAARLEDAAANRELDLAAESVEQIRQTCNQCHRFFRPSSVISPDVAYDWYAFDLGGAP